MSTSGTSSFSLNKSQMISRAFHLINKYDLNSTVGADDYSLASDILNSMLKMWETEGIKLWKRRQGALFTQLDQHSYEIGSASGADHCARTYVTTTSSAAAADAATTITLTTVTGMAVSDNIGVELDDGTRQWTTITAIDSGTKVVTFTTALTGAAASGNTVITYTSKIIRPLRILRATTKDLSSNNNEVAMQDVSYDDYFNMPQKDTPGRPNNFYYDRLINNSIPYTGTLYLYPEPNNVAQIMLFTYLEPIQDMTATTDDVDFPQEWTWPIIFNLACELAYAYGRFTELEKLQPKADQLKFIMSEFDNDDASVSFTVDPFSR